MKKINVLLILFLSIYVSFSQEKEKILTLLYENDDRRIRFNNEIIFIDEFNIGFLEGSSWLVIWQELEYNTRRLHNSLYVYNIDHNNNEIIYRRMLSLKSFDELDNIRRWYGDLHGVTINNDTCQIYDFNGDGYDELLMFRYGSPAPELLIYGFDPRTNRIELFCEAPCHISTNVNQSSPIEFITYKGMRGIKIQNNTAPYSWYFYAWDLNQYRYIKIEEYQKEIEIISEVLNQVIEEEVIIETQEKTNIYNKDSFPLLIMFLIGSGVIVITGLIVVLIKRNMNHKKGEKI